MRKRIAMLIAGCIMGGYVCTEANDIYSKSPAEVTLKELFEMADCVVMGKIEKVKVEKETELLPVEVVKERLSKEEKETGEKRMHLLEERRKLEMVYTYALLSPEKWLKNEGKEKDVLIQVMGGTSKEDKNGVVLTVFVNYIGGTPVFKKGKKVLVFLEKIEGKPYYRVVCDARGEYVIEKDKIYNIHQKESLMSLKGFLEEINKIKDEIKAKEVKEK
jgi:hypothetical protein